MQAVVLSVGDELVLGQTVDTNSAFLSSQLVRLGIGTVYHQTVPDDQPAIVRAIQHAAAAAQLIIITGGLGPTADDLTRQALAQAIDSPLIIDEPSLRTLQAYFARRARPMPETNKVQAMRPASAQCIPNATGTAPGLHATLGQTVIYIMPGVPSEMLAMWRDTIFPAIDRAASRSPILTLTVHTFGVGESWLAEKLGPLMDRARNPKVGTTVSGGVVSVRIRSEFTDPKKCQEELDDTARQVESVLGPFVYGSDGKTLQQAVVELLVSRNQTVATAESCTGGLIGKMLTDVAGSSAAYLGGWVTYSDAMKSKHLGVNPATIAQHGAVSKEVAAEMATGALHKSDANYALAVTGIAGPQGGDAGKPVGTVWLALATSASGAPVETMLLTLSGDRDTIRDRTAKCALQLLRLNMLGVQIDNWTWGRKA